jgi:hypothetical protein
LSDAVTDDPTRGPVVSTAFGARTRVGFCQSALQRHSRSILFPGTANSVPRMFS